MHFDVFYGADIDLGFIHYFLEQELLRSSVWVGGREGFSAVVHCGTGDDT